MEGRRRYMHFAASGAGLRRVFTITGSILVIALVGALIFRKSPQAAVGPFLQHG